MGRNRSAAARASQCLDTVIDREDLRTILRGALYGLMVMLAVLFLGLALGAGVRAFLWASGL